MWARLILFVDDLKQYQEIIKVLKDMKLIILWSVVIVFEHGKMVRGEGLTVLHQRMEIMDPDETEIYRFLGIEQADGMKTKVVIELVKSEAEKGEDASEHRT